MSINTNVNDYATSGGGTESQTLSLSGNTISISNGNSITISGNSGLTGAGGQSMSLNNLGMTDQSVTNSASFASTVVRLANTISNTFINGTTYNATTGTLTIGENANYLISFSVRFGVNFAVTASSTYLSGLTINGTLLFTNTQFVEVANASRNTVQVQSVTIPLTLTAGTTIQLIASQNDTSPKTISPSRGTFLNIARLSGN
jgi:hypothetical protein